MVAHLHAMTVDRPAVGDRTRRAHDCAAARRPILGAALWLVQGLLAALFLVAGGVKFLLPAELLEQGGLPAPFLHFIGAAEVLGALGLVCRGCCASGRVRRPWPPLGSASS